MGLFVPQPTLEPGESVVASLAANHSQGMRAVGGRIFLTTAYLRFVANRVDRGTGGADLVIPRRAITGTGLAEPSLADGPVSGGLRTRLQVSTTRGVELFVVNKVEKVAAQILQWATT